MIQSSINVSLKGLELGISGAIPDPKDWTEPIQDRAILEFVSVLSGLVIKYGGRIVHGAHPSFTPVILQQVQKLQPKSESKAVSIFISELWAKNMSSSEKQRISTLAELKICDQPIAGPECDADVRNAALTSMRRAMISNMNSMVAVGGMMHQRDGLIAGVQEELTLAQKRGMACFLVGGFGGMAAALAAKLDPGSFKNELANEYSETLLQGKDIAATVNIIFSHLAHTPSIFQRSLASLD